MNLDVLRQRFRDRCRDDLQKLGSIPHPAAGIESTEQKDLLIEVSHRISGSAGIFGFAPLSDIANALESLLIEPAIDFPAVGKAYGHLVDALAEVASDTA